MPSIAKAADRGGIERHLPRWQDTNALGLGDGALAVGIERAQGIDLVVEQIDAHRIVGAHREYVDQRTAHRELAALGDGIRGAIAGGRQPPPLLVDVERLANGEH